MNVQNIEISIGRTWRFTSKGQGCVAVNASGYRRQINQLKNRTECDGFVLPWPEYPSKFWKYMLAPEYQNAPTEQLVATLLPMRWTTKSIASGENGGSTGDGEATPLQIDAEAFLHPFAITTMIHIRGPVSEPLPSDMSAAFESLRSMTQTWTTFQDVRKNAKQVRVRDGLPANVLPNIPTKSFERESLGLQSAGEFKLISGLHDEPDGLSAASSLASEFGNLPSANDSVKLLTDRSGLAKNGRTIGLTLWSGLPRAERRIHCLHHNYSLLLAYMENLKTFPTGDLPESAKWFRNQSEKLLTGLTERTTTVDNQESVYKSRLPELWMS